MTVENTQEQPTTETQEPTSEAPETSSAEVQEGDGAEEQLYAGKYKTVDDLEKGYRELSKMAREGKVEVPESYSFDEVEGIDTESKMLEGMLPVFKDAGLSQEQAAKLVSAYAEHEASMLTDPEAELAKLGEDGKASLNRINAFLEKNELGFEQQELEALKDTFYTAEQITAFSKILDGLSSRSIPTEQTGEEAGDPDELVSQAMQLRKSDGFDRDPANIKKYNDLMQRAARLQLAAQK